MKSGDRGKKLAKNMLIVAPCSIEAFFETTQESKWFS